MKITEQQYWTFENIRQNGACNMFDTPCIIQESEFEDEPLTREQISFIRNNYGELTNKFKKHLTT